MENYTFCLSSKSWVVSWIELSVHSVLPLRLELIASVLEVNAASAIKVVEVWGLEGVNSHIPIIIFNRRLVDNLAVACVYACKGGVVANCIGGVVNAVPEG